jgi:hypothetical protein
MKATLVLWERHQIGDAGLAEIRIWNVPKPVRGSAHDYKYSLALVVDDVCVMRFDNEAGKGDHLHIGDVEVPYLFVGPDRLVDDFWRAVDQWMDDK